jgi:hypothetical protein
LIFSVLVGLGKKWQVLGGHGHKKGTAKGRILPERPRSGVRIMPGGNTRKHAPERIIGGGCHYDTL